MSSVPRPSFFERQLYNYLNKQSGRGFRVTSPSGSRVFGDQNDIAAEMIVKDTSLFVDLVLHADIGLGEGYMHGLWDSPDITEVIRWFAENADPRRTRINSAYMAFVRTVLKIFFTADRLRHVLRPNNKRIARRNISQHYDLSNEFFALWLDESMTYSSAIFQSPEDSLARAQANKYEALCRRLDLQKEDHLLEVGCGWGSFSLYAAQNYGCRVTAITISQKQFEKATERVREAGLQDQIEIRFQDYRDVRGQFDKIASIEMVEALGYRYFDAFFGQMNRLLAPRGVMAIQCITIPDRNFDRYRRSTDWIQKYIFPGGLLLSNYEILRSLKRTGDLGVYHMDSFGPHYGRTLRLWREEFDRKLDEVRELGFDEVFLKRWRYYLAACEAIFSARKLNVVHLTFSRHHNPNLAYVAEETLRAVT